MDQNKLGTNYYAKLTDEVWVRFTDEEEGFVDNAKCNGNPNVVAMQSDIYLTGCLMRREDILTGQNIYSNQGTLAVPNWVIGAGGISDITGLIVAGTNINITGTGTSLDPYIINATGSGTTPGLGAVLAVSMLTDDYDIQSPDGGISGSLVANSAGAGFYSGFYTYGMHVDTAGLLTGNSIDTVLTQSTSYSNTTTNGTDTSWLINDLSHLEAGFSSGASVSGLTFSTDLSQIGTTTGVQNIVAPTIQFMDTGLGVISYFDTINHQFFIGTPSVYNTGFSAAPLVVTGNERYFFEGLLQNTSKGSTSSTDWIVSNDADDGTALTGHFGDLGINSSVYSDPTYSAFGGANAVYLYANFGQLSLGTSKGHDLVMFTGGTDTSNLKLNLAWATPTLKLGSTSTTGIYQILSANTKILSITASASALNNWTLTLPNDVPASTGYMLTSDTAGKTQWTAPATGTVTSVSVTTANGVSGTVATATTTPAITLTLGNITPTSVKIGTLSYTDTNILESLQASANSYVQEILQNTNAGAAASTDIVVSNNNGTATTNYGNFGMNSSGWVGSGAFNVAGNVYLTSTTVDLAIGTMTANAIHFVVNNSATDSMTISSTGAINMPSLTSSKVVFTDSSKNLTSTGIGTSAQFIKGDGSLDSSTYLTSITGTTNRITVTGGTVIDISSSYVGQSSITTHGTITSGGLGTGAVIGGVTMTLGSDATNDMYYRNSSGILTRFASANNGVLVTGASGIPSVASTIPNANLANSAITINGTSVSLGGTRTLALASSDFANNGTTTTVLIGNGAGNPSFGQVNLTSMVTGVLPPANGGMDTATYHNLYFAGGTIGTAAAAATYVSCGNLATQLSGTAITTWSGVTIINIRSADYPTVNGLAPKLRIRGVISTNHTAPGINFTFGLYPLVQPASSGGIAVKTFTLGTVVSGSNGATISTPSADTTNNIVGSDFALPADGFYAIGCLSSGSNAANSFVLFESALQIHNA